MTVLTEYRSAGTQFFTSTGAPLALGVLTYYQAGTTNYGVTYQDSGGTTPNGNTITLDSAGRLPVSVYFSTLYSYKELLQDASGATISPWPIDNIPPTPSASTPSSYAAAYWPTVTKSATGILTTADLLGNLIEGVTTSAGIALTLPSAVTAGNGFGGIISKPVSANTLTVNTQSAQTINGTSSVVMTAQYDAYLFISDGANWRASEWIYGNSITPDKLAATIISGMTAVTSVDRSNDYYMIHSNAAGAPRKALVKMAERYPDAMPSWRILNQTTATPPGSPSEGDAYIVATGGTGAWSGWDGTIAHYFNGAWKQETPGEGWYIWDLSAHAEYIYTGAVWTPSLGLNGATLLATPHGGTLKVGMWEESLTLSGASTNSVNTLPNQGVVFGVSTRVTTTITNGTGGTTFEVGTSGNASAFGSSLPLTAGTTNQGVSVQSTYGGNVVVTPSAGSFTGGVVRLTCYYATISPATS